MRIIKASIFILFSCLFIQGCVSAEKTMKLAPQVLSGQELITQDKSEAVISHKRATSAALRPPPDGYSLSGCPMIYISVYGTESFEFSTDDIRVFVDDSTHQILDHYELAEEIKGRKERELAEKEYRYEAQSREIANEGYRYTGENTNAPKRAIEIGRDTRQHGYIYDVEEVAANQVAIETRREMELNALEIKTGRTLTALDALMLKKTIVTPNKWHSGYFAIDKIPDPGKTHEIKILVTVAGEEHEFLLRHSSI